MNNGWLSTSRGTYEGSSFPCLKLETEIFKDLKIIGWIWKVYILKLEFTANLISKNLFTRFIWIYRWHIVNKLESLLCCHLAINNWLLKHGNALQPGETDHNAKNDCNSDTTRVNTVFLTLKIDDGIILHTVWTKQTCEEKVVAEVSGRAEYEQTPGESYQCTWLIRLVPNLS